MKTFLFILCTFLSITVIIESGYIARNFSPFILSPILPKPLLAYTFQNLKKTNTPISQITLGPTLKSNQKVISQLFYFETPEKPGSKIMKKVSGLANIPNSSGTYPVIIMFRGFVSSEMYSPGIGTQPVAQALANNGFITLAPDFLGFGQSDPAATDSFENRFQTYTTALSMLSSIKTLNAALSASYSGSIIADLSHIGIWGHSNGGHIALATLAISGINFPTVLWAPVSVSFPYSILYYTNESDDQGKVLRKVLAQFEQLYNTDSFSPSNYYNWIKAPLQIEQGTSDHEVPVWWTDALVASLKKDGLSVSYNTHQDADHNMLPSGWTPTVDNTIQFFNKQFSQ